MRDELLAAGLANQRRHAFAEAERCYKLVLAGSPRDPVALYRMGVLALQCANGAGALHYLGAARAVAPLDADGCYHLGMAHALQYDFPAAQRAFEEALLHDPQHPSAAISLGNVHKALGRPAEAARAYLQAVASPRLASVLMSQVLVGLHTNPTVTPAVLFELHREWARRFARPLYPAAPAFPNVREPGRALRVGLLSPKLTGDIVGHFLRGVVPALARRTELFLYHAGTEADAITGELRGAVRNWRDIADQDDAVAFRTIRADAIDVLVDLAGHAPDNRLLLFARRPAPVQIAWLDYFDTTGLDTMDVIVSDPVTTPPESLASGAQRFVERVARVPHTRLCYTPPPFAPDVAPPPVLQAGSITFGSFARADKLAPDVLATWARVLHAVPGSRLLLKSAGLAIPFARQRVTEALVAAGVAEDRIELRAASDHATMLRQYGDVDIALDTFPYTGGATTCDALWMGVPVVTLAGTTMIARQGAALLTAAGLPQLVAEDVDGFVAIARALAADPAHLETLRRGMRERLARSPLCDGEAFAAAFMDVVREAWERWCAAPAVTAEGVGT